MINDGKGQGIRLVDSEETKTQHAGKMPVSNKARRRRNGDADDQYNHQDKGGNRRYLEVKGKEKNIDGKGVNKPYQKGQKENLKKAFTVADNLEAIQKIMEQPVQRIFPLFRPLFR